jgi:hypothetical protein
MCHIYRLRLQQTAVVRRAVGDGVAPLAAASRRRRRAAHPPTASNLRRRRNDCDKNRQPYAERAYAGYIVMQTVVCGARLCCIFRPTKT